jgi:hypothetical protein
MICNGYGAMLVLAIAKISWGDVPTWVNTTLALVGLVLVIVAACFARGQLNEAKTLRREQLRPYVFVDLEPNPETQTYLDIVVGNCGQTGAYDVTFEFQPPLVSTLDEHAGCDNHRPIAEQLMFDQSVLTLPPGKTLRTLFEKNADRRGSDLPPQHRVLIRYYGTSRRVTGSNLGPRSEKDHRFEDVFLLDLRVYQDVHYLEKVDQTRSRSGYTRVVPGTTAP